MRTRDHIAVAMLALAFALGSAPAFAFDPPRPGAGAVEVDPPRPPGTIPRARAVVPATIPNPAGVAMPLPRPAPPPAVQPIPALVVPPVDTRLGPPDAPLDPPNVPAFAPSNTPLAPVTPFEAFRSGAQELRHGGDKQKALRALEYAAERGFVMAQWKLGRMYAEGDGVEQSDLRAFEYFSRIADSHADDLPGTPQARFIANAFVALGHYYSVGIANSHVQADLVLARKMYLHAATYFGDPEAQYFYGRTLLDGAGGAKDPRRAAQWFNSAANKGQSKDPRRAAQWFNSAANKGQSKAQAVLVRMLFKGEPGVPRQAARGLMWLSVAKSNAAASDAWIGDLYESAFKQANADERALAGEFLLQWMNGRRD